MPSDPNQNAANIWGDFAPEAGASTVLNGSSPAPATAIGVAQQSYDVAGGTSINLGSIFSIVNPQVSTFTLQLRDRDNYPGNQTYNYGTLTDASGRQYSGLDITLRFTLNPTTGQYVTSTGQTLSNFTFTASTQALRAQAIDLKAYGSNNQLLDDRTADVVTSVPTPAFAAGSSISNDIAVEAQSFIGQTWNDNGCFLLAEDDTAACGVSLPLNSGWPSSNSTNNGAMQVVYDAANGINPNWESGLQPGDIVGMSWIGPNAGGHIAVVDRVTNGVAYVADNSGASVPGGNASDVLVAEQPLSASNAYMDPNSIDVYRVTGSLSAPGSALPASPTGIASIVNGGSMAAGADPASSAQTAGLGSSVTLTPTSLFGMTTLDAFFNSQAYTANQQNGAYSGLAQA